MTKGVPLLGYRMRTCSECNELFDPKKGEITYEQVHYYEETADTCAMSQWLEYLCGCKDVRERIMKRLGLDTARMRILVLFLRRKRRRIL